MAIEEQQRVTLQEFLALTDEEPALELEPDGTVTQKVSPKGKHSAAQKGVLKLIDKFAPPRSVVALPELRTVFGGAAYVPDVCVYRWDRVAWTPEGEIPDDFTEPPDIAIEIASPGQNVTRLIRRCIWYIDQGVTLALLVDPADKTVLRFGQNAPTQALHGTDRIDLSDVLPQLDATVEQLFESLKG